MHPSALWELRKLLGAANLADIGTKVLSGENTNCICAALGMRLEQGTGTGYLRVVA